MNPVLNNTKWKELQDAMYNLRPDSPQWRSRCVENGYESNWDGDWFYHFKLDGYDSIEWVEIKIESEEQREKVLTELIKINLPGETTEMGFKIFGYISNNEYVDYLR